MPRVRPLLAFLLAVACSVVGPSSSAIASIVTAHTVTPTGIVEGKDQQRYIPTAAGNNGTPQPRAVKVDPNSGASSVHVRFAEVNGNVRELAFDSRDSLAPLPRWLPARHRSHRSGGAAREPAVPAAGQQLRLAPVKSQSQCPSSGVRRAWGKVKALCRQRAKRGAASRHNSLRRSTLDGNIGFQRRTP